MPYNMWFVTHSARKISAAEWIELATGFRDGLKAEVTTGTPKDWQRIHVEGAENWWWFDVERSLVTKNDSQWIEYYGFESRLEVAKPETNARWVEKYLRNVQTIYKFECSTSGSEENMDLVDEFVRKLREKPKGGLLYAELEGWKNELGAHITWDFSEGVMGGCLMAVHRPGRWAYFKMELGDPKQREAFEAGEVPAGVEFKEYAD